MFWKPSLKATGNDGACFQLGEVAGGWHRLGAGTGLGPAGGPRAMSEALPMEGKGLPEALVKRGGSALSGWFPWEPPAARMEDVGWEVQGDLPSS